MSLPDPILNFRVKQPVKDAFQLVAGQLGEGPGPLGRRWLIERIATYSTLRCLRSVGLTEVLRRLSQPSLAFSMPDDTEIDAEAPVQTSANIVLQGGK